MFLFKNDFSGPTSCFALHFKESILALKALYACLDRTQYEKDWLLQKVEAI